MRKAPAVAAKLALLVVVLLAAGLRPAAATEHGLITIGTGGILGIYYPTGGAVCLFVNRHRDEHGIRCSVEPSGGSVDNLHALRAGELEFAVVQSDWQYHAYNGTSRFEEEGPFEGLRSVFSVHPEAFTVVARADSGIESFDDLKGKRVNVGNPGSGQRATMEVVMQAKGWSMQDFALAGEIKSTDQARALCDGKIDAFVFTVGHPAGSILEATTACDSRLIEAAGPAIEKLVEERQYYSWVTIPGGMYRNNPEDTKTFGLRATFVTSAEVPEDLVYTVVSSVFGNLEDFKARHPAFALLDARDMVDAALTAPLHPGARTYYEEAGLL